MTLAQFCWENYFKCEKVSGLKPWKIKKNGGIVERKKCRCWDNDNQQVGDSVWKMLTWKDIKSWKIISNIKDQPVRRRRIFPIWVLGKEYFCGIFEIQSQHEAVAGCSPCQVISVLCVPVFPSVKQLYGFWLLSWSVLMYIYVDVIKSHIQLVLC